MNSITFNKAFNKSIKNVIFPDSINMIIFGEYFSRDLSRVQWPQQLHTIIFNKKFMYSLCNVNWPISLMSFIEYAEYEHFNTVKWPPNLHVLSAGFMFNPHNVNLPESLHKLVYRRSYDK
jgi:hypothetical protein